LDILFIHPNFPGQFRRLVTALSQEPDIKVYSLGDESWMPAFELPALQRLSYAKPEPKGAATHAYVQGFEAGVRRGQQVVRTLLAQKRAGLEPEVIYIHPGWGDGLYLKEIFPNSTIIGLFEYYYHARGADVGFDPEFPLSFDDLFRVRTLNTLQLHALESCDIHISPTAWQKSRYPKAYQAQIQCLHEGIDTEQVCPNSNASFTLANGQIIRAGDEVLTFVSRSLEPYRGFHCLMKALPEIMRLRPECQVLIVGQEEAHYGPEPKQEESWKAQCLKEWVGQIDTERLHFTGLLVFADYLKVLQISRVHVYLSYPFILSWSMLEAMSAGCLVLGSETAPVQEVIKQGENGLLFPFFDTKALVTMATAALAQPQDADHLRLAARRTIQTHYDFKQVIYPKHLNLLRNVHEITELLT
jgi:glycosyltransferase involved in cell wall biosynthesis